MKRIATIAGLALLCASGARAEDAPQFRGPGGAGVSNETQLPLTWNAKENVRWKASLPGRGLSNPVTAGGRVFVTASSRVNQNRLHVLCFDQKSGKPLWERQFWATGHTQCHPKTNMAAPTPIADGKHVFALFATADLVCLDHDGNLVWARSLVGDYPTVGNNVGMAASPVLVGDAIVVHMENVGESFAVAVDRATGVNRWRIERPRIINWNTPFVLGAGDAAQVLLATPKGLTAHDPATGRQLWAFDGAKCSTSPSVVAGDGVVILPADKLTALAVEGVKPTVRWQNAKLNPGFASPVVYQGHVYTVSNRGVAQCAEIKSGKVLWSERFEGSFAASPLAGAGGVYFVSEEGTTYVTAAGPSTKLLATNELSDTFLACPVASNGAIFLRSDKNLYCIANP